MSFKIGKTITYFIKNTKTNQCHEVFHILIWRLWCSFKLYVWRFLYLIMTKRNKFVKSFKAQFIFFIITFFQDYVLWWLSWLVLKMYTLIYKSLVNVTRLLVQLKLPVCNAIFVSIVLIWRYTRELHCILGMSWTFIKCFVLSQQKTAKQFF